MYANTANKERVLFKELSYRICGLCFKIHNDLGRFRNEKQYADAFLNKKLGIIINFRQKYLNPKRVINANL